MEQTKFYKVSEKCLRIFMEVLFPLYSNVLTTNSCWHHHRDPWLLESRLSSPNFEVCHNISNCPWLQLLLQVNYI